jgi:hypothetical protein
MFKNLCGEKGMRDVVIVTTMWNRLGGYESEGEMREAELKSDYWADMMAEGCTVERFEDTYDSAWRIVSGGELPENELRAEVAKVPVPRETAHRRLRFKRTKAGMTLTRDAELKKLPKARKAMSRRVQALRKSRGNELNRLDNRITQTVVEPE